MNGCLIPDTPIRVDLWRRANNPSSNIYFLSHMHSDHTQGLSASWRWPIYCSSVSGKLLIDKFQIKESLVRPLELNQSHIIKLDHLGRESMTVTLFDASHCPGSVMFLFEGYFGRILYTGDFRYDSTTFPEWCLGPGRPLDKLYLDNTFNNPRCRFPSRAECKQKILEILARHPEHEVVLGVYTLGKEDLLLDIALALKTRVVVSPARMRMLQVLEVLDVFTTDKDGGCVRLVPQRAINKKNMAKWNEDAPTIAVIPTGLFSTLDGQPFVNQEDVFIIPYSDHSSYPELRQFVSRVHPRVIIPIVKDSCFMNNDRSVTDMHNFDDLLDRSPSAPFTIPSSVLQFMSADLSGSVHLGESHQNFKLLAEMRKNQRLVRANRTATGVVFRDEDDEGGTTAVQSLELSTTVDSQELPLAESEYSQPDEQQTLHPQLTRTVNCQIKETKASIREVTSELKPLQTEPLHQSSSENRWTEVPAGAAVRKRDFLSKKRKRKSDQSESSGDAECPSDGSVLIRSMSSKKPRVLPESCVTYPKSVITAPSSWESRRLSCAKPSSKKIQDYFKTLSVVTSENEPCSGPKQLEHKLNACRISLASLQAVTPLVDKPSERIVTSSSAYQPQEEVVKLVNGLISSTLQRINVVSPKNGFSSQHICVKPFKQISGSQKSNSLSKAFQNVFTNQK
ncbi:5' exonuclease Apollo-like [Patiria miniata]|uniref:5' exonuclease Apollo n=1 Tax=Patiria miniata TaxID=46514 RepID=A0A914ACA4_PATMI|nr:5' exonuclease Apollo-like [Patiria miniata]